MPLCIGTDEAGYGPNLGPLVVTATAWQLPEHVAPDEMWKILSGVVTQTRDRKGEKLHVADSKQVYSASGSLAHLERSVHAFLQQLTMRTDSLEELCCDLAGPGFHADYKQVCGGLIADLQLPIETKPAKLAADKSSLAAELKSSGVRLTGINCRIIFPPEFNRLVAKAGSKGIVLSQATLQLVRELYEDSNQKTGSVICDKHGGRNRYDQVISEAFDDGFVFRLEESGPRSRYRIHDLEFCIRTKAEELMPAALASMVAKYLRELVMIQFNRFWQHHIPGLKPTKGYPLDAKRFWQDIETKSQELELKKSSLWRCR